MAQEERLYRGTNEINAQIQSSLKAERAADKVKFIMSAEECVSKIVDGPLKVKQYMA